jgi:hypothetical protein
MTEDILWAFVVLPLGVLVALALLASFVLGLVALTEGSRAERIIGGLWVWFLIGSFALAMQMRAA